MPLRLCHSPKSGFDTGKSTNTIRRRVVAIAAVHTSFDHPDPTKAQKVKQALAKVTRAQGAAPRKVEPLTWPSIVQLLGALDRSTPAGQRDAAAILIGFGAALRRSELVALEVGDIRHRVDDGDDVLAVNVRSSKTDQAGKGALITVRCHPDPDLNAHVAVQTWLKTSAITEGPIIRGLTRTGGPRPTAMSPIVFARRLKQLAVRAGIEQAELVSGHSLRRGWATSAAQAGVDQTAIQHHGRWSTAAIAAGYQQAAGTASSDAATAIYGHG